MNTLEIAFRKGYRVTPEGIPVSKNGIIKPLIKKSGYAVINIHTGGKSKQLPLHRLQAYQKFGNDIFKEGIEVRHLNGIKHDNSLANISIGTHSENMQDIPKHIRVSTATYASSKIKKYDKETVRKYYSGCNSYEKTMKEFNISSKGTLHYVLNN